MGAKNSQGLEHGELNDVLQIGQNSSKACVRAYNVPRHHCASQ